LISAINVLLDSLPGLAASKMVAVVCQAEGREEGRSSDLT